MQYVEAETASARNNKKQPGLQGAGRSNSMNWCMCFLLSRTSYLTYEPRFLLLSPSQWKNGCMACLAMNAAGVPFEGALSAVQMKVLCVLR